MAPRLQHRNMTNKMAHSNQLSQTAQLQSPTPSESASQTRRRAKRGGRGRRYKPFDYTAVDEPVEPPSQEENSQLSVESSAPGGVPLTEEQQVVSDYSQSVASDKTPQIATDDDGHDQLPSHQSSDTDETVAAQSPQAKFTTGKLNQSVQILKRPANPTQPAQSEQHHVKFGNFRPVAILNRSDNLTQPAQIQQRHYKPAEFKQVGQDQQRQDTPVDYAVQDEQYHDPPLTYSQAAQAQQHHDPPYTYAQAAQAQQRHDSPFGYDQAVQHQQYHDAPVTYSQAAQSQRIESRVKNRQAVQYQQRDAREYEYLAQRTENLQTTPNYPSYHQASNISQQGVTSSAHHPHSGAFPPGFAQRLVQQPSDFPLLPQPLAFPTPDAPIYNQQLGGYFSQDNINYVLHIIYIKTMQEQQKQMAERAQQDQQAQHPQHPQPAQQNVLSPVAATFNPCGAQKSAPPPSSSAAADDASSTASKSFDEKYAWVRRMIARERAAEMERNKTKHGHSRSLSAADPSVASQPGAPGTVIPARKTVIRATDMAAADDSWRVFRLALEQSGAGRAGDGCVPGGVGSEEAGASEETSSAANERLGRKVQCSDEELFGAFGFRAPGVEQKKISAAAAPVPSSARPAPPGGVPPVSAGLPDQYFLADTYNARGGHKPAAGPSAPSAPSAPAPSAPTKKPLGKAPAPALVPASLPPGGGSAIPKKFQRSSPSAAAAAAGAPKKAPETFKPGGSSWAPFDTSVWNGKQLPKELRRNQPPPADPKGEEGPFKSFLPGLGFDQK